MQHENKFLRRFYCVLIFAGLFVALFANAAKKLNIVLILCDDMGFSDIGCYGSEIPTPNIDSLATNGIRFTSFYNSARCCPSRASLMTGLYPHQAWVGDMVDEYARAVREKLDSQSYSDHMNPHAPTLAEVLRGAGYRTAISGKWHLGYRTNEWPSARGFERSFSVIEGAMNYYGFGIQHTGLITNPPMILDGKVFTPPREGFFATDAFTDFAVQFLKQQTSEKPFFFYLAYTAPHWPLHARAETIAHYRGKYKAVGWDKLRQQRYDRLVKAGIIDARWPLAPRAPRVPAWEKASPQEQEHWDETMSIYAAQIEELDNGVGRVLKTLKDTGADKNTLVLFLSDNGGAAENPNRNLPGSVLGTRESYEGYGINGAHVSSGPFRKTKKFTHEGGIATPLIVRWPNGIPASQNGKLVHEIGHLMDFMPTFMQLSGAKFPKQWNGARTQSPEGIDLSAAFRGEDASRTKPLFWEHEGQRAVRDGKWKLVASFNEPWELHDMDADRTEVKDLAKAHPEIVQRLEGEYDAWAKRVGVKPWPAPKK
jgi:arylsulfatase A-like enzyme